MIRPESGDETRPTPQTDGTSPWDTYGTPAQPAPPAYDDRPTQAIPTVPPPNDPYDRTVIQPQVEPVVPVARVYTPAPEPAVVAPLPVAPLYAEPVNRPPWVVIAAVSALIVGGVVGYVIGHNSASTNASVSTAGTLAPDDTSTVDDAAAEQRVNDIFTLLAAQARQPDGIQTPTPYPPLDDLLSVLGTTATTAVPTDSAAPGSIESLTAERDQLATQVATLQGELTASQTLIDQLQQSASTDGGNSADTQAQLDDQAQQIATLQKNLDTANADLQTAQGQLDAANKTLADLAVKQVENYVGADIAKVRTAAKANGWTLVEQPIENATAAVNSVTAQTPVTGTNMIKGSVLYVEIAAAPGSTG